MSKNHTDGDVTLDTIHFSTENTNNRNETKNTDSPFPLTQVTSNKSDPTLVTSDIENNTTVLALLPFIGTQEKPTIEIQSTLSVHENNQKSLRLVFDDISANMIAPKSSLINEIYDLRQELNQPIKSLNKQEDMTELKTQLQYLQKENQSLKEENGNKRKRIETVLNQNNELFTLNNEVYSKNNVTHSQEKYIKE